MRATVLLDPMLVIPRNHDVEFWERFFEWVGDDRARLGFRMWQHLADLYGNSKIDPPRALSRLVHRAIQDLLGRVPVPHDSTGAAHLLRPEYSGDPRSRELLLDDLVGSSSAPCLALGTDPSMWPTATTSIACDPPPPANIPLYFEPNQPTPEDLRVRSQAWFSERRVLIVGGQIDQNVISSLKSDLGIDPATVQWIPSEHHKKATNLRAVINGLPANAIVVCITGKVGHDVSGQMVSHCSRRRIPLHEVRYASHVRAHFEQISQ